MTEASLATVTVTFIPIAERMNPKDEFLVAVGRPLWQVTREELATFCVEVEQLLDDTLYIGEPT